MAILALDGFCIADVNDAFIAVTGWSRDELLGREHPRGGRGWTPSAYSQDGIASRSSRCERRRARGT